MDTLEFQRRMAEYDEKIAFHEASAKQVELEKSRFLSAVLKATQEARDSGTLPGNVDVIKKG